METFMSSLITASSNTSRVSSTLSPSSGTTRMSLTRPIRMPEMRTFAFFSRPSFDRNRTLYSFRFLNRPWRSLTAKSITTVMTKDVRMKAPARISFFRYSMVTSRSEATYVIDVI